MTDPFHIVDWDGLLKQEKELRAEEWLFRGMSCASWGLEPSLERACKTYYGKQDLSKAAYLENILTREFRRRYHDHKIGISDPIGIEWLSLMQHYGAPTRLLDFTYSFFVAAYFAIEKPCEQSCPCAGCAILNLISRRLSKVNSHAIWAIRSDWIKEGIKLLEDDGKDVRYLTIEQNEWKWKFEEQWDLQEPFFESLLNLRRKDRNPEDEDPIKRSQNVPSCAFPVNAMRLNERSTIQQGVFICPGNVTQSFEKNLKSLQGFDNPQNLRKLVILFSPEQRLDALKRLHAMSINKATLYPGLQGFADSLGIYHPVALK